MECGHIPIAYEYMNSDTKNSRRQVLKSNIFIHQDHPNLSSHHGVFALEDDDLGKHGVHLIFFQYILVFKRNHVLLQTLHGIRERGYNFLRANDENKIGRRKNNMRQLAAGI